MAFGPVLALHMYEPKSHRVTESRVLTRFRDFLGGAGNSRSLTVAALSRLRVFAGSYGVAPVK